MKKTLYSTTFLATAGLLALTGGDAFGQAAAPAAEKLKLGLGGYMFQRVGYTDQSDSFAHNGTGQDANQRRGFDQKGDSEIYFMGSLKLDNGLTVAVRSELENNNASASASWDATYMTIGSATLGTLYLGTTDAAAFFLGVGAPFAGHQMYDGSRDDWIQRPAASKTLSYGNSSYSGGNDYNRVEYISPSFMGLRIGGGYAPSSTADDESVPVSNANHWNVAAQYAEKFGDFGVRAYAGYWRIDSTITSTTDTWSVGADVKFADFTLGGGFARSTNPQPGGSDSAGTLSHPDDQNWSVGLAYAPGPLKVAVTYAREKASDTYSDPDDDEFTAYQLGVEYSMGPGVTLKGWFNRQVFEDELNTAATENKAWTLGAGIQVDF